MKKTIVGLCMVLLASVAWALPSLQDVEAQVKQGNYTQAESMMREVVAAKPDSARARYVHAELLAHQGDFGKAAEETAKARQLDPKLSFTDPEKFRSFEQTLQREQNPPARSTSVAPRASTTASNLGGASSPAGSGPGLPSWIWLVGLVIVGIVLWKMLARSRAATMPANYAAAGGAAYPGGAGPMGGMGGPGGNYGPGAGYGPGAAPAGRPGSGLLGTGLAVAGGVAGGMLIDEMLHRRSDSGSSAAGIGGLGGLDPNSYNPSSDAAGELENRQIDFGSGNDWDSGGGSSDSGSSDSGSSWD